jgi:putative tryptophan/tyrosine transport system substrate-binding protein
MSPVVALSCLSGMSARMVSIGGKADVSRRSRKRRSSPAAEIGQIEIPQRSSAVLSFPSGAREALAVKRREFITFLGGAAAAWPLTARAQQPAMPTIGFLNGASPEGYAPYATAFRQGLKEAGYVDGQNVTIEYRWAEGRYERLPTLAADLVRRQVSVIAATSTPAMLVAKAATSTIPIVFTTGADPVKLGFVASLNQPGANATGVSFFTAEMGSKQAGLVHELIPAAAHVGLLVNPNFPATDAQTRDVTTAASAIGFQIDVMQASDSREIEAAFGALVRNRADALLVVGLEIPATLLARADEVIE